MTKYKKLLKTLLRYEETYGFNNICKWFFWQFFLKFQVCHVLSYQLNFLLIVAKYKMLNKILFTSSTQKNFCPTENFKCFTGPKPFIMVPPCPRKILLEIWEKTSQTTGDFIIMIEWIGKYEYGQHFPECIIRTCMDLHTRFRFLAQNLAMRRVGHRTCMNFLAFVTVSKVWCFEA